MELVSTLNGLMLSVSDAKVSLKSSNGDRKLQFFRRDYNFTMIRRKHTPLYEKDTKQNKNSPMETTRGDEKKFDW